MMLSPENLIPDGTIIEGRYEIQGTLGYGGFAVVYRGWQINVGQPVAIKVLNTPPGAPQSFVERFYREAKTAAQIRHPDVVTIFDYGITNHGSPYIALELLSGLALEDEIITNGPLEPKRAVRLFTRCLDALEAAHQLGIIHRDLKPANLFITNPHSRVESLRILDFGISFILDDLSKDRLTGTGQFLGTPQYLAPEYAQNHTVTSALDVYQMGLILVEMLTGSPVVDSDNTYQCILKHCTGSLDLNELIVNSPLGPVVLKALETDPANRYVSASDFRDALESVDMSLMPMLPFKNEWHKKTTEGSLNTLSQMMAIHPDEVLKITNRPTPSSESTNPPKSRTTWPKTSSSTHQNRGANPFPLKTTHEVSAGPPSNMSSQITTNEPPKETGTRRRGLIIGMSGFLTILLMGTFLITFAYSKKSSQAEDDDNSTPKSNAVVAEVIDEPEVDVELQEKTLTDRIVDEPQVDLLGSDDAGAPTEVDIIENSANIGDDPEDIASDISLTVTVTPATAKIFKNDEVIGTGAATLVFKHSGDEAVLITAKAPGYMPEGIKISPTTDPEKLNVILKPREKVTKRPFTRETKKTKVTEATKPQTPDPGEIKPKNTRKPIGFFDDKKAKKNGKAKENKIKFFE